MARDVIPVLEVVERIYDAVADRLRWPAGLTSMTRLVDGTIAFLLARSKTGEWTCIASSGVTVEEAAAYAGHWSRYDPLLNQLAAGSDSHGDISRLRRADCGEMPFFLHFGDALTLQSAVMAMEVTPGLAVIIWGPRSQGFDAAQVSALGDVWPHVRRAWSLQSPAWIPALDREPDGALALLEHWPLGVVGLAASGAVRYANRHARDLAESGDGFAFAIDGPVGHNTAETGRLRAAIRVIAEEPSAEKWLRLTRASGLRPYEVSLRSTGPFAGGANEIAMFVSDPERRHPLPGAALQALHGLTPNEAAVAQRVAQGLSAEVIAGELDISLRTVRWYLEQLRGKLGVTSQTELVRLILTGPIALTAGLGSH